MISELFAEEIINLKKERDQLKEELVRLRGTFNNAVVGTHLFKLTVVFNGVPGEPMIGETLDAIGTMIQQPIHWVMVADGMTTAKCKCQLHYCLRLIQGLAGKKSIFSITVE